VDIYEKPRTESVARFIGYVNLFEGVVVQVDGAHGLGRIRTSLGEIEAALGKAGVEAGERIHVVIRPETVRVNAPEGDGGAKRSTAAFETWSTRAPRSSIRSTSRAPT
jgi:putrescine transport system ATP-binding protein